MNEYNLWLLLPLRLRGWHTVQKWPRMIPQFILLCVNIRFPRCRPCHQCVRVRKWERTREREGVCLCLSVDSRDISPEVLSATRLQILIDSTLPSLPAASVCQTQTQHYGFTAKYQYPLNMYAGAIKYLKKPCWYLHSYYCSVAINRTGNCTRWALHPWFEMTHESTWFSKDRMMGKGEVLKAHSAIASITS